MQKVVLISCVSKKLPHKAKARELYTSPLFKYGLRYAESLNPDKIFVLSAEYGLVGLEQEIDPYNRTLNKMKSRERKEWANKVLSQLEGKVDLQKDEVIFLAGKKYREHLISHIKNPKIPLEVMGIGKQLKYLKERA